MTLTPGTRIGPYQIIRLLGAGGMGNVFLAEDETLGRKVVLKALPPAFVADDDRRRRFEREARAVAALNHPNIVTIYGVEHAGDALPVARSLRRGPGARLDGLRRLRVRDDARVRAVRPARGDEEMTAWGSRRSLDRSSHWQLTAER